MKDLFTQRTLYLNKPAFSTKKFVPEQYLFHIKFQKESGERSA